MKRTTAALLVAIVLGFALWNDSSAQSRIYWIGENIWKDNDVIWTDDDVFWINVAGTDSGAFSMRPGGVMTAIAVDQSTGWIYSTDLVMGHGYNGDLRRARIHDTSDPEYVLNSWATSGGLEIDPTEGIAYFARLEGDTDFSMIRGNVETGAEEAWLFLDHIYVVAMDIDVKARLLFAVTGDIIYDGTVSVTGGNRLMRAQFDKDVAETVDIDWSAVGLSDPGLGSGLALDSTYRKVYVPSAGRIYRVQYMGGAPTLVYDAGDAAVSQLALDPVSRTLFWVEKRNDTASGTTWAIMKAQVGGTIPWKSTLVRNVGSVSSMAVFADPGAAKLQYPAPDAAVETTVEVSWDAVLGSPRYDILIASDPYFNDLVYKENLPGTHTEFVAPVADRDYYWRVQSNACFIAPHWSETRRLVVGHTGSLAATLTHPAAGAVIEPSDTFTWTAAPSAATYSLEIATEPDFAPVMVQEPGLSETSYLVEGLERGETYYWRIAGVDEGGRYTFTAPQSFTVAQLLTAVSLAAPDDGAVGVSTFAKVEWTPLAGAESYDLEVSTTPDFSETIVAESLSEVEYTFDSALPYESTFYWRVRGVNQSGPGEWSAAWSFTTAVGTSNEASTDVPSETRLMPPYPNPASKMVTIPIELSGAGPARIEVFDLTGRTVRGVDLAPGAPGRRDFKLDVGNWPAGTYFVVLNGDRRHAAAMVID